MDSLHTQCGGQALANAVRECYRAGQTDYALEPLVLVDAGRRPLGRIQDGDGVIFCCRRGEREIQLTDAFVDPAFAHFPRRGFRDLDFVLLTLYHEKYLDLPVAFAPESLSDTLGQVVSRAGRRQWHVAESEKFAHVTFFINGGHHEAFPGEEDVCVPSPRGIPFERVPELGLAQVAEQIRCGIASNYDLIVANLANGDVIGHTTQRAAKIECAEKVDTHLGQIVDAAVAAGYVVLVTADHGNLERMTSPDGTPHVAHTANPVPFVLVDPHAPAPSPLREGKLADVAPTILDALALPAPRAMTGVSLASDYDWGGPRRVLLLILDGWGIGPADDTNPIHLASTPVWDGMLQRYPWTRLQSAGTAVGLRPDRPGNSEAGHLNLGAGRIVLQDDLRLECALQDGSFYSNAVFCRAIDRTKRKRACLHLIGLLSEASSHGTIEYPLALLRLAQSRGLTRVSLHLVFDGRSTAPGSAPAMLEKLASQIAEIGIGQIVSGIGRGLALDRDGNYDKTKRAYDALVFGVGKSVPLA